MASTTAITPAKPVRPIDTLRHMLEVSKEQISLALPKHMTPERMIRVAVTAVQRNPKLLECSPLSIVGAVIEASQLGLEPDGVLGRGYLVPRWNGKTKQVECGFQVGYRGLIDLALRSGQVSWIAAELVYDCDKFIVKYGTERSIIHEPDIDNQERGSKDEHGHVAGLRGAYAVVKMKDGTTDFEYMNRVQLDQIRARSEAIKKGFSSPWDTDEDEMFRKAPIRRGAKRWPLSPEFQQAAIMDEYADAGVAPSATEIVDPLSEAVRVATEQNQERLKGRYLPPETKAEESANPQSPSQDGSQQPATAAEETGTQGVMSSSPTQEAEQAQERMHSRRRGRGDTRQQPTASDLGFPQGGNPDAE